MRYTLILFIFVISCGKKHVYKYELTNRKTGFKYYCDTLTNRNDTLGFQNSNNTFIPITNMGQLQNIQGFKNTNNIQYGCSTNK